MFIITEEITGESFLVDAPTVQDAITLAEKHIPLKEYQDIYKALQGVELARFFQ